MLFKKLAQTFLRNCGHACALLLSNRLQRFEKFKTYIPTCILLPRVIFFQFRICAFCIFVFLHNFLCRARNCGIARCGSIIFIQQNVPCQKRLSSQKNCNLMQQKKVVNFFASSIVQLVRIFGIHPKDLGSSPGGGNFIKKNQHRIKRFLFLV